MSKVVKGVGKAVGSVAKAAVSVVKKVAPIALPIIGIATGNPWLAAAGGAIGGGINGGLKGALLGGALGYAGGAFSNAATNAGGVGNLFSNGFGNGLSQIGSSMMNPGTITDAFTGIGSSLSNSFNNVTGGLFNSSGQANAGVLDAMKTATDANGNALFNGTHFLNPNNGLYDLAANQSGFLSAGGGSMFDTAGKILTSPLLATGLSAAGGWLQGQQAQDAGATAAQAQIQAARIAADAAKFRPVGVTTRFGQSKFGYDSQGNVNSAGYLLAPDMLGEQNALLESAYKDYLPQFLNAKTNTAPMGTAASSMMNLGNQYLTTSPQAQAAKYMAEQQALLAPTNQRELADLQARLSAQGRLGVATGATTDGMNASNPELEAYYNALNMQNRNLAANATQGGMDYAKFGSGMVGSGGDMLNAMYGVQSNSLNPYNTALGGAQTIEGLGQNALTMGMNMGSTVSAANAQSGNLLAQGMNNAAQTMQPANAQSNWGTLLSGAGNALTNYTANNNQQQNQMNMMTAYLQGIDSPLNKWSNA
jgi:hypothetical protein